MAVLKASMRGICLLKIIVSSAIEVSNPLMIASPIMAMMGQAIPVS
jgi:hypothetical protein